MIREIGEIVVAEIVEFDCISIFPGLAFSSGLSMIKDAITR